MTVPNPKRIRYILLKMARANYEIYRNPFNGQFELLGIRTIKSEIISASEFDYLFRNKLIKRKKHGVTYFIITDEGIKKINATPIWNRLIQRFMSHK